MKGLNTEIEIEVAYEGTRKANKTGKQSDKEIKIRQ
jgi:hypothetical protein